MAPGVRVRYAALRAAIHQRHQQHQIDGDQRQRAAHVNAHGGAAAAAGTLAGRVLPIRARHGGHQAEPGGRCDCGA